MAFIVSGGDPAPVFELVEQSLDQVAPAVFGPVVQSRRAAVGLGADHRFDSCFGDLVTDGVGIVAAISKEGLDPITDHAEQRSKALLATPDPATAKDGS